jgi:hypothetical protein
MSMDFNDAERQSSGGGEPIPDGTVAPVIVNLREKKTGKTDSRVKGLDLEFTVTAGPYKGKKAWKWAGYEGSGSDGHNKMVAITRSFIRGMIESAYGIDPTDDSPAAIEGRRLQEWEDLHLMEFVARFGIEKGDDYEDKRTGELKKGTDKNTIRAVTPDDPDYAGFKPAKKAKGAAKANGTTAVSAPAGNRPAWA